MTIQEFREALPILEQEAVKALSIYFERSREASTKYYASVTASMRGGEEIAIRTIEYNGYTKEYKVLTDLDFTLHEEQEALFANSRGFRSGFLIYLYQIRHLGYNIFPCGSYR